MAVVRKNICLGILPGMVKEKPGFFPFLYTSPCPVSVAHSSLNKWLEFHLAVPCRAVTQGEYGLSSFVLAPVAFPETTLRWDLLHILSCLWLVNVLAVILERYLFNITNLVKACVVIMLHSRRHLILNEGQQNVMEIWTNIVILGWTSIPSKAVAELA